MRTLPLGLAPLIDQIPHICDASLDQWIRASLQKGADPNEMVEALLSTGRPLESCALLVHLAARGFHIGGGIDPRNAPRSVMGTPDVPHGQQHWIDLGDRQVRKIMSLGSLDCILYEGMLSDEECEHIKTVSGPYLKRSAVVGKNFSNVETRIRTSAGAFLDRGMDPTITAIEDRVARLTGVPADRGEGLQVLHYTDAQEYQPHYDFFEPQSEDEARMMAQPGNRIGTMIFYLNDVEEGGSTYFPQLQLAVHPKKGSAVWFGYLGEDGVPDRRSEHAGLPVISGEKWIATKWLRERTFNPGPIVKGQAPGGMNQETVERAAMARAGYDQPGGSGGGDNVTPFPGKRE